MLRTIMFESMKTEGTDNSLFSVLVLACSLLSAASVVDALPYDYGASIQCEAKPPGPQYGGGILINPELNDGLRGWTNFGGAVKIEHRVSYDGNGFIVASNRTQPYHSVAQKAYLKKDRLYSLSAWVQVDNGDAAVTATFKTPEGYKHAGAVFARSGCWSMIKGGLTMDSSGLSEFYFESNDTSVEIWIDSVSLQPFTEKEWRIHQDQSLQKIRKSRLRIQVVDAQGNPLKTPTNITITQNRPSFPFGVAINKNILTNAGYQSWFESRRFTATTFEDEMKWYSTEPARGQEDYSVPDAMLRFTRRNGVQVRGHNVFWDDPSYQPGWISSLPADDLRRAANKRLESIVSRYRGQVIAWDVVNENLHFSYFEGKLGGDASTRFYLQAHVIDGRTTMFLNDYNTIEDSRDGASSPAEYVRKVREIQSRGPTGIGLEGHFKLPPDPAYIRSALDTLAAARLPIWITELDVFPGPNQASYLEQILREVHAHPAVEGIVIWSAWKPQGCYQMCLTDNNFKNLPTGDVVDKLLSEWGGKPLFGTTDADGLFEASVFHGNYQVKAVNPNSSTNVDSSKVESQSIEVTVSDDDYSRQGVITVRASSP